MNASTIKTSIGYVISVMLVTMGIRGIIDPISFSTTYGMPAEESATSYVPVACARSIALGLSIGSLLFQDQKRAAGTVLSTAFVVGGLDTWITYRSAGTWTAAVLSHVWGDAMFGAVGLWLMA